MAELLKGAPVARALTETLCAESDALRARDVTPTLAILRVGERDGDLAYERGAIKRCEQCGVAVRQVILPEDVTQDSLLAQLATLNADSTVHGILPLRPLPFDTAACAAIVPQKDVDGVASASMAALYAGAGTGFAPCTAEACLTLLKHYNIPLAGKRAVVVGRSLVIGKPVAQLLLAENATVTTAHRRTADLPAVCREADILVVAAGSAGLISAKHVREDQVIIDVGIHANPGGTLCGDVRFDEVAPIVRAITPVPGGVGPVTTAVLCQHVIKEASH